jgi:hypothetical protein
LVKNWYRSTILNGVFVAGTSSSSGTKAQLTELKRCKQAARSARGTRRRIGC